MNSGDTRMADHERVYWDSCAWLGLANAEEDRVGPLRNLYIQAQRGSLEIWTSTISIVEANRLDAEYNQPKPISKESLRALDDLFFQPFVKLVSIDAGIARDARLLIRETPKLSKKPDAIHLASAIFWSIPVLHTYDGNDLLHLDGDKTCRDGTALRICKPGEETNGGLFDKSKDSG